MKKQHLLFTGFIMLGTLLSACSKDNDYGDGDSEGNIKNQTMLNTMAFDKWVYFSFEQAKEVIVTDPRNDLSWDIAIHRSDIKLNGGLSGNGKGSAVSAGVKDFASVTSIPQTGYTTDTKARILLKMAATEEASIYEEGGSRNEIVSKAITSAGMPPVFTLSNEVYIVKTASGRHLKLKFVSYTNDEGTGGHPVFGYDFLEDKAPVAKQTQTLNAGNFPAWVYFSFVQGREVAVADPKNDLNWDIAFHVGDIKLNGGDSGKGQGGAVAITDEALKLAPESGYTFDVKSESILLGMPPTYEVDGSKNAVISAYVKKAGMGYSATDNNLYVVKTVSGKYVKIKFTNFAVNLNGSMGMAGTAEVPGIYTFEYYYQPDGTRNF